MNQNFVKTIGIKDQSRKESHLVYVNRVDGLKGILDKDAQAEAPQITGEARKAWAAWIAAKPKG